MQRPLEHWNSSFWQGGVEGGTSGGGGDKQTAFTSLFFSKKEWKREFESENSRQLLSSLPSPQLLTPSHRFESGRHTRSLRQRNCLVGGHWNLTRRHTRFFEVKETEYILERAGGGADAQKSSPHSAGFSSELSPQSSSPSHFQPRGLQSVLLHWNSSRGQCRLTEPRGDGLKDA